MRAVLIAFVLAFSLGIVTGQTRLETASAQSASGVQCAGARAQLRTTLYFGTLKMKGGAVSELDWQMFLRDEVTKRFPDGLTVWDAEGQWKTPATGVIAHERSKVLLLVHADTPAARGAIQQLITQYRQAFDQESVLWETARVCIS